MGQDGSEVAHDNVSLRYLGFLLEALDPSSPPFSGCAAHDLAIWIKIKFRRFRRLPLSTKYYPRYSRRLSRGWEGELAYTTIFDAFSLASRCLLRGFDEIRYKNIFGVAVQ